MAILFPAAIAFGCSGTGCAPDAPPAAKPAAPVRFEPAKGDHSDLAVGETVVERVALVADAPSDWNALEVVTSCDCMSARFVDRSDPKRAWVEVEYHHDDVEDIDGVLTATDPKQQRDVATYESPIVMKRRPFVQPRRVVLEAGGSPRFEVVIGQAFAKSDALPQFLLDDFKFDDDAKIAMVDAPKDETRTSADQKSIVLQTTLAFEVNEAAREKKDSVKVAVRFGAPVVERVVEVSWPGSH